jgi:4-amino-4-deoxy-L-arabinose transferase-like glycosyltransferase
MSLKSVTDKLERPQSKLFLLLAVTLLAAFFRLYRIEHLPPGDGYDPAFYGVDALQILRGARPIFLPPNREALFSYIVTACFLLFGASTQAIHLASALVGILTVPAVYLVAEELFADEQGLLKRFGGLAAALMVAVSYWHLNWSRYGVRAILVPFFAALTLYFLWRGLRRKSLWAFVMCGASLGLSMYTYQAARLLPVLIVIGFVCKQSGVVRDRKTITRQDWRNFLVVAGVASLVFAPLGHYFLTHPGSFSQRIEQAFVVEEAQDTADKLRSLLDQSVRALLAFNFVGDRDPYSTIAGRPSLNPFLSAFFFLGIGVSLTRARRPGYLFLLVWLGVMLIPATLAGKAPTAKRAIGTLPAVAMLIAIGALVPCQFLRRRSVSWSKRLGIVWGILLVGGGIYSGIVTYRDYFVTWASNPGMFTHFEVGISAIGEYVGELPPGEQVYISPELPAHPGIRFHSGLREEIKGYNGRVCLVIPEQLTTATTYVIVPSKDNHSLDLLRRYLPQGEVVDEGPLHYNEPYFLAYRILAGAQVEATPVYPMAVSLGDQVRLLGYDLDKSIYQAGDAIHLTLYYQGLRPMATHYTVFVHLLGPHNPATDGPLWGQDDSEPCRALYPTTSWDVGEIIIDRFTLPIPAETPAGDYDLKMGFYDLWTMERLPVLDESGETKDNIVSLGQVQVIGTR